MWRAQGEGRGARGQMVCVCEMTWGVGRGAWDAAACVRACVRTYGLAYVLVRICTTYVLLRY